ncbi:hypothetical protein Nepgr_006397 [Nepenthes gracilis]|uniref:Spen paralogue and orthologue SPOC C-terminal domain-containing protein n=1 Tax=Nepenthes gracilis TaxID=150966 RepID=A0AAD3XHB0_NEPGR|nr:hypothetical protein Nepgr_006397 [Nepenthes gracilis]
MHPSRKLQEAHIGNNMSFPTTSAASGGETLAEWSRKRKFTSSDQPSNMAPLMEYDFSRRSNLHLNVSGVQGNDLGTYIPAMQPQEFLNFWQRCDINGPWDEKNQAAYAQPNERIFNDTRAGNPGYTSFSRQLRSLQCKEAPNLLNMTSEQTCMASNFWPSTCGSFSQSEAHESTSHREKAENSHYLPDIPHYGQARPLQSKHMVSAVIPASKSMVLHEHLRHNFVEPSMSVFDLHGKVNSQENRKDEPSCTDQTDSMGTSDFFKQHDKGILMHSRIELRSTSYGIGLTDSFSSNDQGYGNVDSMIMKTKGPSDSQDLNHSLIVETPCKHGEAYPNFVGHDLNSELSRGSTKLDESDESDTVASKLGEMLWDGSLQLSSAVKVSAVAYFKSGEKMPDINWSESVEVIGKTRLDAFEKYIQDLPRSRNRGLMVVSICWKEGSSRDGLEGIKEVAKKYKEGKRVGFAQLLSGVDLYICPRSDTIITILAKHGFFKGKVAVEDNQDSLIGCVVWRKTLPSDSSTKRSEKNVSKIEQPPSSTSNLTTQHLDSKNSPSAAPNQESIPPESLNGQITTKSEGNDIKENKNPESSTVQPELGSSHSNASPAECPNVSSSSIPAGHRTFPPADLATLHKTIMELTEIEVSVFQSLGLEKLKANLELLKTTLPPPTSEDDDLPEYDFKTTVPQAMSSKSSQADAIDERPQAKGVRDYHGSLPWKIGIVGKVPSSRAPDVHEGSPQQKLVQELESQIPSLPDMQQKPSMNCTKLKSLFDDDDMPEWRPPDFEPPKRPVEQKTGPSFAANAFPFPKRSFLNSIPGHLPPPHTTSSMQPPFSAKTFTHASPPSPALSKKAAPPSPRPPPPVSGRVHRDPDSRVCTSNPVLRPQLDPRGHIPHGHICPPGRRVRN